MYPITSCHNFSNEKTKSDHLFGNESKLQLRQELWEKHKLSKSRSADGLGKDISGREDTCGFAEASLKDEDDNDRDDDTDHDEDVVEEIAEMASSKAAYSFHIYNPNEFVDQRLNIAKEFNSAIYAFNLHETNQAGFKDNNLLRIRVKGQAFMLK